MGLHLTGLIRIPLLYREKRFEGPTRPTSLFGAGLVGAAFAFGWTPCVGPILGGILTLAGARETVLEGMGLLTVYSAGLAVPFLLTAWSVERFLGALRRLRDHFRTIELVSGGLLVAVGVLVLTDQLTRMNSVLLLPRRDRGEARRGAALKARWLAIAAAVLVACGGARARSRGACGRRPPSSSPTCRARPCVSPTSPGAPW